MSPKISSLKTAEFFSHPGKLKPRSMSGAAVAVIDVLRATTAIIAALQHGAKRVVPCATVSQARRVAQRQIQAGEAVLLAGERHSQRIPGFDLGNSPVEFTRVRNQTVVMTTTNGTRALAAARGAPMVIAACLNNAQAAADFLLAAGAEKIVLLAAGETGSHSIEDTLAAGLIVSFLQTAGVRLGAAAQNAAALAQACLKKNSRNMTRILITTPHGRELARWGMAQDIHWAGRVNSTRMVGVMTQQGLVAAQAPKNRKLISPPTEIHSRSHPRKIH